MRKLRKWKMWAIMNAHDSIDAWDERAAIYWYRHTAREAVKEYSFPQTSEVIRIEVRELPRRKR